MASKQAISRLRKELKAINADPPPHIHVSCDESNILSWSYLLEGPDDTPYAGGWYWGSLKFPKNYPFAPPSIMMITPNGRFETNVRLCLSMSDYHPESWQPAWSLATVLKGLLSFMCEECPTAGAIDPPPPSEDRQRLARGSLAWNTGRDDFLKAFPEVERIVAEAEARRAPRAGVASNAAALVDDDRPRQAAGAGQDVAPARGGGGAGAAGPPLAPGDVVRLRGLKSRTDLNGREGLVEATGAGTAAAGRIRVTVDGESVGVKPENLERPQGRPGGASATAPGTAEAGITFERVDEDDLGPGTAGRLTTSP